MPSTSAALQSKQQGRYGLNAMASSNSAVSGKQDSYSVAAAQHQSAAAMQPQVAPVKRRPRPAVEAAVAMLHDPKQLQLTQSGASSYPVGVYGEQPLGAPAAGLKGFQLEWPLQPVNSAQGHLSSAAAKISSAASRYTNAVNAASYSVRAAALVADAASAASVSSSADASSPQEGRRSNLSRRSAHSSAQSFDTASSQLDPFAPSPRLAPEPVPGVRGAALPVQPASAAYQSSSTAQQSSASSQQSMGTGAYASAPSQRGQVQASSSTKGQSPGAPGPTRRALFPANLNDWSISASRNLDAPEMGSPPESDDEESTSGSSEVITQCSHHCITLVRTLAASSALPPAC